MSVRAYVLVQTGVGQSAAVSEQIRRLEGVVVARDVTGPYDVVVEVEAATVDDLGRLVVAQVQTVPGITRTVTCPVVNL
ncbi:Lrp/AsnC family transcriptional regulator [Auraticoccus sp. F435]|uniref:Lrp/AsnC family transcriptional regulator n=1 Tax=Auraticoccus cholistanensis TaxID=2656650 RepID=A0A6A9V0I2_9ACTN|nr:Lrp/AsnC family transcriptional regulator [Auraticoccus cholistanensis]MVA75649.1 Lrp/AsnC family transcriptional regulator [Auraticoccus cholistanensis]